MADSDLERFLSVVKRATLDLDACEIADALWLATHLPAPPKLDEAIGDTARLGDTTAHGGSIVAGAPIVLIGD